MLKKELLEDLSTIGIGRRKLASRYTASPEKVRPGVVVIAGENDSVLRALMYVNIHAEFAIRLSPVSTRLIHNLDGVLERGENPIIIFDTTQSPTTVINTLMDDIRERQAQRSTKIPMIITAYPNTPLHIAGDPDRVLYKPYNMSELLEVVREAEQLRSSFKPTTIEPFELSHWSPQMSLKQLAGG